MNTSLMQCVLSARAAARASQTPEQRRISEIAPWTGLRSWIERGTSTLEMALTVPVIMLLLLGTLDLGQAVVLYNMTSQAAREGARTAQFQVTYDPASPSTPTFTTSQRDAVRTAARRQVSGNIVSTDISPTGGMDAAGGPYVQVVVTAAYRPVTAQFLKVGNIPVRSTSRLYLP